jgi:putative peptide zinc metalloprotease protein
VHGVGPSGAAPAVSPDSARTLPPSAPASGEVLRRADGVQLIGEMTGSGYRVPPALVRRGDGQTLQLTSLLYAVLHAVDGHCDAGQVAEAASAETGRHVTADNVRTLVDEKLRPMGLLARADGSQPELKRANPLLALRFRFSVTDPEWTRRLTGPFTVLFSPLVAAPVLAAFAVVCWWVFFRKGLASATYQAFNHPGLLILVTVVTVLSAGFHEFGHAAAARRGGATPGVMGAGMYLMWPAFYTDVTDSYRLGRLGRIRTDLGGLYFNAIVAVAISAVWAATRYDALLLIVATQILQMIRQLTPLVRFDGYHVLADVTGVPDLFHRIKPTLLGVLPWRWGDPEARLLKPWARTVVTLWVLVVVPALLFMVFAMVIAMPHVLATAWDKLQAEADVFGTAWQHGRVAEVGARLIAMAAVALPIGGTFLILGRMLRRVIRSTWRSTAGHPLRRCLAGLCAVAVGAGLAYAWWPHPGTYRPIQPWDRGTLFDAVAARPAASTPPTVVETRPTRTITAVWDTTTRMPTQAHPQLALVLIPRQGATGTTSAASTAPRTAPQDSGWVFPFNKPLAPGPGDNQALAVNTTDNTADYEAAFALVWVTDGADALNTNSAYAFTSCTHCASVAVAFQVVLVVGDNHVAAPQNLAGALNYNCVNCLSYALAQQLFVTLGQPLSGSSTQQLDALWAQIAAYGDQIAAGAVPLSDIQDTLSGYEQQIKAIIETDEPGTFATPSATASGSSPSSAAASSLPPPSGTPTTGTTAPTPSSASADPTSSSTGTTSASSTSASTTPSDSMSPSASPTSSSSAPSPTG